MAGSFTGHFIAGSLFILYALHWSLYQWRKYFVTFYKLGEVHMVNIQYPCKITSRWGRLPWEGISRIVTSIFAFLYELFVDAMTGSHLGFVNVQHMGSYYLFFLSGVIDVICHYKKDMPKNSGTYALLFALGNEAFGLLYHLHDRYDFDIMVHTLLLYSTLLSVFIVCLELRFPDSPLVSLGRAFSFGVQGSWIMHVGMMLYPPLAGMSPMLPGDPEMFLVDNINDKLMTQFWNDTRNETVKASLEIRIKNARLSDKLYAANYFSFHMCLVLVFICINGALVNRHYKVIAADTYKEECSKLLCCEIENCDCIEPISL